MLEHQKGFKCRKSTFETSLIIMGLLERTKRRLKCNVLNPSCKRFSFLRCNSYHFYVFALLRTENNFFLPHIIGPRCEERKIHNNFLSSPFLLNSLFRQTEAFVFNVYQMWKHKKARILKKFWVALRAINTEARNKKMLHLRAWFYVVSARAPSKAHFSACDIWIRNN